MNEQEKKIEKLEKELEELKRENARLLKEHYYFQSIMKLAENVSLIFSDLNGTDPKVVEFSKGAEKIFGYKREEALGMPIARFHIEEDIKKFPEAFKKMQQMKMGFNGETLLVRKNGEKFPALFSTYPVIDDEGNMIGGLGISFDITHIKELEKKLIESDKQKDKMLSVISHDLKSPFNTIIGFSNILADEDEELEEEEFYDIVNAINTTAKNTYDLLVNLLEWSRTRSGIQKLNPSGFDLTEMVEELIIMYKNIALQKGIEIRFNPLAEYFVYADRSTVSTILRNLISNAIKFTPPGGNIKISLSREPEWIKLGISDSGVGIPADKIPTLFEFIENKSTKGTNNEKGTGLGLVICKEFIDLNKGNIKVDSIPGEGSTFYVYLPRAKD